MNPEAALNTRPLAWPEMAGVKSLNFRVNVGRDVVVRGGYENVMAGKGGQQGNGCAVKSGIAQRRRKRANRQRQWEEKERKHKEKERKEMKE